MKISLLSLSFHVCLFVLLTIGFFLFTIIGTVSHESGHYLAARCFGYQAKIHYGSTSVEWYSPQELEFLKSVFQKYPTQIKLDQPFPERERYLKIRNSYQKTGYWITAGGPVQTMVTGTIGLIFLVLLRKKYFSSERLSFGLWFVIFITLFWLRQTANLFLVLPMSIYRGKFSGYGDEFGLARHWHIPSWSIVTVTAVIGIVILAVVIFKFVPIKQRLTFIAAGIVGGVTGFIFWLVLFGKMIMQ
jgi:hypothetical protein